MYFSTASSTILFFSLAASHMILRSPTPFAASKLAGDNGPLLADGSNFPCKFGYDTEGANNVMPLGSQQELAFIGGATHGGGSCQVSITYDKAPTANSKFKVIHSIVGGCPARNADGNIASTSSYNDPDKYSFKIPENLPTGDVVLAWTWFNKIGNREMYMNCAPVTLTGPVANRETNVNETGMARRDMAAFESLPDMFVANIGNGCKTKDSSDLQFDDPGARVEVLSSEALAGPVGTCAQSKKASSASKNPDATTPVGGAFFTTAPPNPQVNAAPASAASATPSSGLTPGDSPNAASPAESLPTSAAAATLDPLPADSSNISTSPQSTFSGSVAPGSPCSPEGAWNCIDGKSFQRCASGTWTVSMPLAAGTSCKSGVSAAIKLSTIDRRHVRFSNAHLRRHLRNFKSF